MKLKNVVNTQNVANVILEKLNNESKLVLINKVVEAAQTQFTNLSAELKTSVSKLQKKLDEVEQKASVLEKFELGQVEEAINETLKKMASEGLFETLCLDINGQRYKLGSLIQKLATADRVVNFLYGWDSGYSELKSITAVLDDGTNVVLNGSYEDVKDDKGNITGRVYKFATDNWKGYDFLVLPPPNQQSIALMATIAKQCRAIQFQYNGYIRYTPTLNHLYPGELNLF